jgi:predicted ArsR family transcriptional regulator
LSAGTAIRRAADLIALMVNAPRTAPELAKVAGVDVKTAQRWIAALADEGLLEVDGKRQGAMGHPARVWRWAYRPAGDAAC